MLNAECKMQNAKCKIDIYMIYAKCDIYVYKVKKSRREKGYLKENKP